MRNTKRCSKCNGTNIGHLDSIPDRTEASEPAKQSIGITRGKKNAGMLLAPRIEHEIEVYVCTTCGYLEYYAKQPETVPFEEIRGFSWYSRSG